MSSAWPCSSSSPLASSESCGDRAPAAPPKTPEQALADSVNSALGDSNRNIARLTRNRLDNDGTYEVHWNINDNLTSGMIRTGAKLALRGTAKPG